MDQNGCLASIQLAVNRLTKSERERPTTTKKWTENERQTEKQGIGGKERERQYREIERQRDREWIGKQRERDGRIARREGKD